jgi:hypothetical protein
MNDIIGANVTLRIAYETSAQDQLAASAVIE